MSIALALRSALHAAGFRYRLHGKGMPGRPDIVITKYRAVIFVHGCSWHRHADCRYTTTPATRPDFWQAKFEANLARDKIVHADLMLAGWRMATVWECALRTADGIAATRDTFAAWLKDDLDEIEIGEADTPPVEGGLRRKGAERQNTLTTSPVSIRFTKSTATPFQ